MFINRLAASVVRKEVAKNPEVSCTSVLNAVSIEDDDKLSIHLIDIVQEILLWLDLVVLVLLTHPFHLVVHELHQLRRTLDDRPLAIAQHPAFQVIHASY